MECKAEQVMAKSPEEIEEGIRSTQTVKWDPFTVFPKEIYLEIFKKLDNPIDKQTFMNAHIEWYNLFKSKRKLCLFEAVLEQLVNKIGFDLSSQDAFNFRLVCPGWNVAIQNHFQLHSSHFKLHNLIRGPTPSPRSGWMPKRFTWRTAQALEEDLEIFSVTHPPSKNPFLSRSISLYWQNWQNSIEEMRQIWKYRSSVDSLLENYGKHIWHCKIIIEGKILPETCRRIPKWLSLMPELRTLELTYSGALTFSFNQIDQEGIEKMGIPRPHLNKLVSLKSSYLPAPFFNNLFGDLKNLEKLRIGVPNCNKFVLKDFEVPTNRENLQEAFFTLKGRQDFEYFCSSEPFPNMKTLVISLRHNHYKERDHPKYVDWPSWTLAWNILEEKFPALEELTLRLPKAALPSDKLGAINQSLGSTLNLEGLKRLWIVLPNLCSIDFLLLCKALEEIRIIWENGNEGVDALDSPCEYVKVSEKIKFNGAFSAMWESNIWGELPKLRILEISAYRREPGGWIDFYRYEKAEEKRNYEAKIYNGCFLSI